VIGGTRYATVATIIPTYRRPDQLRKAVASALGQTYRDIVVVVVDDGAGLPSLPHDPRLIAVSLSRNCGVAGVVRNVGLGLCDSLFVAFLDDDNWWEPNHLETAINAFSPDDDVVYSAVQRWTDEGVARDRWAKNFDRRALRNEAIVDINSMVARRTSRLRFSRLRRRRLRFPSEDWELSWRFRRRWRFRLVDVVTVNYLLNPASYFYGWSADGAPRAT